MVTKREGGQDPYSDENRKLEELVAVSTELKFDD